MNNTMEKLKNLFEAVAKKNEKEILKTFDVRLSMYRNYDTETKTYIQKFKINDIQFCNKTGWETFTTYAGSLDEVIDEYMKKMGVAINEEDDTELL